MKRGFTLIELIVVIIIVGILAAVGISQYSTTVEKFRLAEAKVRIGAMRQLAYEYYLTNGTLTGITNSYVGVDDNCTSTNFYKYSIWPTSTYVELYADRCMDSGKTPNAWNGYIYYFRFYPQGSGVSSWHCAWNADNSSCFGLPP